MIVYSDNAAGLGHDMCRISQYKRAGISRASSNHHPFQNAAKHIFDSGKQKSIATNLTATRFFSTLRADGDTNTISPPLLSTHLRVASPLEHKTRVDFVLLFTKQRLENHSHPALIHTWTFFFPQQSTLRLRGGGGDSGKNKAVYFFSKEGRYLYSCGHHIHVRSCRAGTKTFKKESFVAVAPSPFFKNTQIFGNALTAACVCHPASFMA